MSVIPVHRRTLILALLALIALIGTACGDSDSADSRITDVVTDDDGTPSDDTDEDDHGPHDEDEDDDEGRDKDRDRERDENTRDKAPTVTTEVAPLTGGDCLVGGVWTLDNAAWAQMFQAGAPSELTLVSHGGAVTVEFRAGGSTTTTYDAWTLVTRVDEAPGDLTIVRSGVDQGTFAVTDDTILALADTTVGSIISMDMAGMPAPPGMPMATPGALSGGSHRFECSGGRLTIAIDGGQIVLTQGEAGGW